MKQDLKKLIREYAYGDCSQIQIDALQEILKSDPAARELFLSEMNLLSALEDIAVNTNLSEIALPVMDEDSKANSGPAFLSNWAMPFAITVAVLLLITSIFWQRNKSKSLATDRTSIEAKEKKQKRERAQDSDQVDGSVDINGERDKPYPNWVVEKGIMTLEELRTYEDALVAKSFEREQIPKAMESVVRLAFQIKDKESDVAYAKLMKKIIADSDWDEDQVELLVALSKRLSGMSGFKQRREKD